MGAQAKFDKSTYYKLSKFEYEKASKSHSIGVVNKNFSIVARLKIKKTK